MPMKKTIGHIQCPTCGFPDMEVKIDKREHAFAYCPDCDQTMFTHKDRKSKLLLSRMRPLESHQAESPAKAESESHEDEGVFL